MVILPEQHGNSEANLEFSVGAFRNSSRYSANVGIRCAANCQNGTRGRTRLRGDTRRASSARNVGEVGEGTEAAFIMHKGFLPGGFISIWDALVILILDHNLQGVAGGGHWASISTQIDQGSTLLPYHLQAASQHASISGLPTACRIHINAVVPWLLVHFPEIALLFLPPAI